MTFDQPLFWKASMIIQESQMGSELRDIILMLGSFHTFMNLLGAIGFLMSGSGLEDILKQIFADDAVVHLLSGKAVSRAFRGHLIVDTYLNSLLFSLLKSENKIDESRLEYISNLFDISNSSLNDTNLKEITSDSYLLEMQKRFKNLKRNVQWHLKHASSGLNTKIWFILQGS